MSRAFARLKMAIPAVLSVFGAYTCAAGKKIPPPEIKKAPCINIKDPLINRFCT